jgi:hypothetical protein
VLSDYYGLVTLSPSTWNLLCFLSRKNLSE